MKITVGSTNKAKVEAVRTALRSMEIEAEVTGTGTDSEVSAQPVGDEETMTGARNRAKAAASTVPGSVGIGLEGGVRELDGRLYICNWGALALPDGTVFTAGGAQLPLPEEVAAPVRAGQELGPVMEQYSLQEDIRQTGGAVGVFTSGRVGRPDMFGHIVRLLVGQWQFKDGDGAVASGPEHA
ncbi:DUF84 family protein [Edaphobacillus lindanitolerans]|uniref:DUF84 family protein n=1 Tax=Edaphobacillus lindanitolerans TaxID=550447 RepID=UPI00190E9E45|nr:DUF84 family protein [Edaphobacillus lindanitolerans]